MKRTNLLEYLYFDLQLNFVDLSLLSPHILLCVYLLCCVSVRYICENAAFKDAKRYASVITFVLVFSSSESACEMKIRARDWWFFTCFFSFS